MKIEYALLLAALVIVLPGCSALKQLVHNGETVLNNVMDGGHGVVTNVVNTATTPLQ